jgi:hypothetical protein
MFWLFFLLRDVVSKECANVSCHHHSAFDRGSTRHDLLFSNHRINGSAVRVGFYVGAHRTMIEAHFVVLTRMG